MSTVISQRQQLATGAAIKAPCAAATNANCNLNGAQTVGGVAVGATTPATRVLCFGQTNPTQNGVYDVQTGPWTRSLDADGVGDFVQGTIGIINGGTYADEWWIMTSAADSTGWVIPDTDAMTFQVGIPALAILGASSGAGLVGYGTTTVAASLNQILYTGKITMLRNATGTWCVYDQNSNLVNISASTTDGLQEAINLACTPHGTAGYDLEVIGGDESTAGAIVINCTTTVNIPPTQGKRIRIGAVTINFGAGLGANNGVQIDSTEMTDIDMSGCQIVYAGTGWSLAFQPTNGTPGDNIITCGDTRFHCTTVCCTPGASGCVLFNCTGGVISDSLFTFNEINSLGGTGVGIKVNDAAQPFIYNEVHCGQLHDGTGTELYVGNSNYGNKFRMRGIFPATSAGPAVYVNGQSNEFEIGIGAGEGTPALGIKLDTMASLNKFHILRNDATVPCLDSSSDGSNEGMFGWWKPRSLVNLNNVNQTGIPTATFTKLLFDSEYYNTFGYFDLITNHRWIPKRIGFANISAAAQWVNSVDGTTGTIAIYKNGAEFVESRSSTGSVGVLGMHISCMVQVTAVTDYFEIWVSQNSGSNQDIEGGATQTWASFELIDG